MGDPKKQKKKYHKPLMVWNEERIARDKEIVKDYGLKNKREIWKVESKLKSIHNQSKKLIAQDTEQAKKESAQLMKKLSSLNLIQQDAKIDNALSLTIQDLLNRRLQTLVFKNGMSRTINQARQFITHNHVSIDGQIINVPSYLVSLKEEPLISFNETSSLSSTEHPERIRKEQEVHEKPKSKESDVEEKKADKKTRKSSSQRQRNPKASKKKEAKDVIPVAEKAHKEK